MTSPNPSNTTEKHSPELFLSEALAGVEQGLSQLKKMYKEAEDAKSAVDAARQTVETEREAVKQQLAQADALRAELDARRAELAKSEEAVSADRGALEELTSEHRRLCEEFDGRRRTFEEEKKSTTELAESLVERERRLIELDAELSKRRESVESREASLLRACEELDASNAKVDELRRTLEARESDLAARQASLDQTRSELETARLDLSRRSDELRKAEERARRDDQQCSQLQSALVAARQQASQTLAALQECTRRAEKAEDDTAALRLELDDTRQKSSDTGTDLERRLAEAAEQSQGLRQQYATLESRERQLASAVEDLRSQLASAHEARAQAQRRAEEATHAAGNNEETRSRLTSLEASLVEAKAATAEAAALAQSREKELADARVILDDTRAQLDQNLKDTQELESVLDQLRDRLRVEAARSETFAQRIAELEEHASTASSTPASAPAAPTADHDTAPRPQVTIIQGDHTQIEPVRRGRLKVAARLARDRARKIRKAGEALATRFEQCEMVLSMRQDVLASKRAVDAAHKQITSKDARGKATTAAFFMACAAAIIGGIAWLAAGQLAPETYLAKATLAADSRERKLTDAELEEWRNFHRAMLDDPRFLQFASERMAKQGIASLATPGSLKDRLRADLSTFDNVPGELTLQMKGVGKERLERDLQAIAVAVQSQARDARERRVDGASTVISESAKAGEGPVESERIYYAAALWGGSLLILGLITGFIWRRLSQAKLQFEASTSLDTVADNTRWMDSKKAA